MTPSDPRTGYAPAAGSAPIGYVAAGADADSSQAAPKFIVAPVVPVRAEGGRAGVPVAFSTIWADYRQWLLLHADVAPGTVSQYRKAIWAFCSPYGYLATLRRPKPWWKATDDDARRWLAQPACSGPRRGEPLAASTRANRTTALKSLYAYAYQVGALRRDPMALLRYPRVGDEQPRSFTTEELATILDAAVAADDDRLELLFWLGYNTLRSHAIAALKLEDFYPRPRPGQLRVVRKGKPGRHWVPLHVGTRVALDRYLAARQLTPGAPLLDNHRWPGQPLEPGSVSRLGWDLIRVRAELPHGSMHWLRHSGATQSAQARKGANIEAVRELLDHTDSRTTRRYIEGVDWHVREEAVDLIPDPRQLGPREVSR